MRPVLVKLGNTAPKERFYASEEDATAGKRSTRYHEGNRVTLFQCNEPDLVTALLTITRTYERMHSDDPPEWVETTDETLAKMLSDYWSWPKDTERDAHECTIGRPEGWQGQDIGDPSPASSEAETQVIDAASVQKLSNVVEGGKDRP